MVKKIGPETLKAIRALTRKWTKSEYAYALYAMDHYNSKGMYYDAFRKEEIVKEFYVQLETKFYLIKEFSIFKDIHTYEH